jgi:ABC-type sugar transport system permease subunit
MSTTTEAANALVTAEAGHPHVDPPSRRLRRVMASLGDSLFIVPAVLGLFAVFLVPTLVGVYRSFTDWQPASPSKFIGLANYRYILHDETFHKVLRNTLIYLVGIPFSVFIPLAVALMLYERTPRASMFRSLYLFPIVFSSAILALLFQSILNPSGLLNSVLRNIGFASLAHDWLGDPALVKFTIIAVVLWGGLGVHVLIFNAALSTIPPDLFEAADLDGASWSKKLRFVMMPGIRPVLAGVTVMTSVQAFIGYFGIISVLTNGGPNYASSALDFDVYTRAYRVFAYGRSAAEAVMLLLMVTVFALFLLLLRSLLLRQRPVRLRTGLTMSERIARTRYVAATRRATRLAIGRVSRTRRTSWSPFRLTVAILIGAMFIYPMLYLISTAVRTERDFNSSPAGAPHSFTLQFVKQAWTQADMGRALINSVISVGIAVALVVVLSCAGAFWFLRHRGPVRALIVASMGLIYFVPPAVWLIPLNSLMVKVSLNNSLIGLGIVQGFNQLPFGMILMTTYLATAAPPEILESARIDGASLLQQFSRIILPLSGPGLAALVSLVTAYAWGDYQVVLILMQDQSKFPVTLAASQLVGKENPGLQPSAAAGLLSMLPMLLLFLTAQRWMVRGINAGTGRV